MRYRKAPEVRDIAARLIAEKHTHLLGIRMLYVFREEAKQTKGHTTWGTAQVLSGFTALLAFGALDNDAPMSDLSWTEPADYAGFQITIGYDVWRVLSPEMQEFLVNHELSHCAIDDETEKPITVPHDIELFYTDAPILGMEPTEFREMFRALQEATLRVEQGTDKQDDGQTTMFDDDNTPGGGTAKPNPRRGRGSRGRQPRGSEKASVEA